MLIIDSVAMGNSHNINVIRLQQLLLLTDDTVQKKKKRRYFSRERNIYTHFKTCLRVLDLLLTLYNNDINCEFI